MEILVSGTFKRNKYYNSSDLLVKFQQDLYNNEMTYDEYEESFTTFKYQHKGNGTNDHCCQRQMSISNWLGTLH